MDDATPPTGPLPPPHDGGTLAFGPIALDVRDPEGVERFYVERLGFEARSGPGGVPSLGPVDGPSLVELHQASREAPPAQGPWRPPGLFHAAFLLPSRADLGRWLVHVSQRDDLRLGQADHLVSEAFYLEDPEANGVEVYRDRPRRAWPRDPDDATRVRMATDPADVRGILAAAGDVAWTGAPAGTRLGHVHLRVSSLEASRRFWCDGLGLEVVAQVPGALFLARDGYHHHIGLNTWQSAGRHAHRDGAPGLRAVRIRLDRAVLDALRDRLGPYVDASSGSSDPTLHLRDPDGIRVNVAPLD